MRICLAASEIIIAHSGASRLRRTLGRELVKRGIEVYVLSPQAKGQKKIEQLDGMVVLSFPYPSLRMFFSQDFFRLPEADIYEIWGHYLTFSYFVTQATSKSKHIMVFCDLLDREFLKAMISVDPRLKQFRKYNNLKIPFLPYYLYLTHLRPYLTKKTVSKGDAYFCTAKYFIPEVKKMYGLKAEPIFMPEPIEAPNHKPVKSPQPTVCFLNRWDAVKRVDRFFDLARHFPKVKFIAIGRGQDPERDRQLWEIGSRIPNLDMPGLVSEEEKREIMEKSWISVNTSAREALSQSYIEACSYRCAILSAANPDDFAQNFGYHVQNDNFESGLESLLENDCWRGKGERGFEYVKETGEINKIIDRRIEIYESLLGRR